MKKTLLTSAFAMVCMYTFGQNIYPSTGNVGIGTSNPQFNLEINGEVPFLKIRSSVYTYNPAVLTIKGGIIFNQENPDKTAAILEAVPPGYHVPGILFGTKTFYDNPGGGYTDWYHRMFIHPNGNVGIGTTDPGEKLSVNGKIRAHEIKVETQNWPDYVLAKDYALPSLKETEKHIHENGHLPGIPSAGDVKANGIDLGEMNSILLKKIEELTIHLIRLDKKVNDQNKILAKRQFGIRKTKTHSK